jgi:ubiquinone/menaquinone biosynthesis C-methylase UbiE
MAERVCPVWIGYLLASPVRKLIQNPNTILRPYITQGMKVMDIGSAMGFFSIPMARMVGTTGKVICVDVQQKMLDVLEKKSNKAGVSGSIELRLCPENSLGINDINEELDFVLASAVLHEVGDVSKLFKEVYHALKKKGKMLIAEPKGHVDEKNFQKTLSFANEAGLTVLDKPGISKSLTALLGKK